MRKSLVGLLLLTTPVAADPVADFQQLLQTVPTLSLQNAPDAQVAWARNFVATLSGKRCAFSAIQSYTSMSSIVSLPRQMYGFRGGKRIESRGWP